MKVNDHYYINNFCKLNEDYKINDWKYGHLCYPNSNGFNYVIEDKCRYCKVVLNESTKILLELNNV